LRARRERREERLAGKEALNGSDTKRQAGAINDSDMKPGHLVAGSHSTRQGLLVIVQSSCAQNACSACVRNHVDSQCTPQEPQHL
jgi:hypothetical protein